jgi:hypothetical protein
LFFAKNSSARNFHSHRLLFQQKTSTNVNKFIISYEPLNCKPFFRRTVIRLKKERNGIGKVGIQAADSPILRFYLPFFSFFKKSCPTISKPEKDILEIRLTECLFFAIIGWGHKKMKLFCTQYARPSRHCFKKNVYLFANDDKTMLRIFSVFLQKTSWNTSGGFL